MFLMQMTFLILYYFYGISKCLLVKQICLPMQEKIPWRRNPFQYSCQGSTMDRRAWQVTVLGIARVKPAHTWRPTLQLKLDKLNKKLLKSYKRFLKLGIRHITIHFFFKLQRFSALSFHLFLYMSSFFFLHELSSSFCLINK